MGDYGDGGKWGDITKGIYFMGGGMVGVGNRYGEITCMSDN